MKPDILRPLHLGVFLAALLRLLATASPAAALASAASLPDGRSMVDRARVRAVERAGNILGVRADSKGRLFYHSLNSRGRKKARALSDPEAARVMSFLRKVPAQDSEAFMAASLQSYLRPRMDPRDLDRNLFVERDSRGFLALTAVGKNALMDILLAEDGQLLEKDIQKLGPAMHPRLCGQDARQCERRPGFSPSAFFARVRPAAAGISPSAGDFASAFDGSRSRPS
ncbi:MAG: hypothetical protein HY551_06895, partial [Elusimicrobia bacterium]|nr:hypothetical protein [Elusimicrobiota bacterium]